MKEDELKSKEEQNLKEERQESIIKDKYQKIKQLKKIMKKMKKKKVKKI